MTITFRDFLLNEDVATEIATLQLQLSNLQTRKSKMERPLDDQIVRIQKMIAQKQQMLSSTRQKPETTPPANTQQQNTNNQAERT